MTDQGHAAGEFSFRPTYRARPLARFSVALCWTVGVGFAAVATTAVQAGQFTTLDPAYAQQIFTGPLVGGPGMAWTSSGNFLTRNGSDILEYDPIASASHLGTSVHPTTVTHSISGLLGGASYGYGIVNGTDGYIYSATGNGVQRIDPNTWVATTPGANLPGIAASVGLGGGYGITVLPDGRIVYIAGAGTNEVYIYNPTASTNTLIYTNPTGLIDDIQASPTGEIAMAGQANNDIVIINALGTLLNTVATTAFPDGLAFGYGPSVNRLFSNDNQGSITAYDFNAGYTSFLGMTTIAAGGSYGDLAQVGPDCALYVSQVFNNNYHGSASFGTRWDDTTVNNEPSVVRISSRDGSCAFAPSPNPVPEPGGIALVMAALGLLALTRRSVSQSKNTVHTAVGRPG